MRSVRDTTDPGNKNAGHCAGSEGSSSTLRRTVCHPQSKCPDWRKNRTQAGRERVTDNSPARCGNIVLIENTNRALPRAPNVSMLLSFSYNAHAMQRAAGRRPIRFDRHTTHGLEPQNIDTFWYDTHRPCAQKLPASG
ncbi:uncharacterized protein SETTUDRAFT_166867 [Exserohilum turcica Et28A]|uniref:Uncharacterized protein n=1 Tax=Exserohilum turcicum (strain 28A) TaxID=671987 RepID=R0KDQ6_EXST2|nr:uncharacterized protein SETTUDRAFT_166867 [Exserohilum turcica Et28A]EOA91013.1 hypothetical protein SETTUDRAFT_166867 [Exserohilum turcica Et28A]